MKDMNGRKVASKTSEDKDVEKAIAIITECRQIHVDWADWQDSDSGWRGRVTPESPGGPEHHRRWVEEYDFVLEVLRRKKEADA